MACPAHILTTSMPSNDISRMHRNLIERDVRPSHRSLKGGTEPESSLVPDNDLRPDFLSLDAIFLGKTGPHL